MLCFWLTQFQAALCLTLVAVLSLCTGAPVAQPQLLGAITNGIANGVSSIAYAGTPYGVYGGGINGLLPGIGAQQQGINLNPYGVAGGYGGQNLQIVPNVGVNGGGYNGGFGGIGINSNGAGYNQGFNNGYNGVPNGFNGGPNNYNNGFNYGGLGGGLSGGGFGLHNGGAVNGFNNGVGFNNAYSGQLLRTG